MTALWCIFICSSIQIERITLQIAICHKFADMANACLILVMYVEGQASLSTLDDSLERPCLSFSASQITNQIDYRKYLACIYYFIF